MKDANESPALATAKSAGVNRRTVLRAGAAGSVVVVALPLACGSEPPPLSNGPVVFGNLSLVPVGRVVPIGVPQVFGFVGRDAQGLYAMTSICTHMGCPLPGPGAQAQVIVCNCHGSRYDLNGAVTKGPAAAPLQHYRVDLAADGTITIQGDVAVSSSDRTPVA